MEDHLMNNKQQGIALVMVLVFLTLLTLISTTAMQQNALQFAMIGNTQEQSQSFASAENILKLAEQNIEQLRWSPARIANPAGPAECRETTPNSKVYGLIPPGTTINLGIAGSTVEIRSWWCQNNPDTAIALADAPATIDRDGNGATDADDLRYGRSASCTLNEVCPTIPTSGFAPFPDTFPLAADDATLGFNEIGCGTELYTIRVTFIQQNESNAERVVESKFAVKCLEVGN
jgi:hypothetical protein